DWADQVWRPGAEVALASFRKDIIIEVCDEGGQLILAYKVHRSWVSKYQALPDLAADGSATIIQSITLEHEGWERDTSVPEPKEPSSS
ncbi:MAG: phage tail protein, partial [Gemmatimonadales bacterium]